VLEAFDGQRHMARIRAPRKISGVDAAVSGLSHATEALFALCEHSR
jgi:hypothetical protein